MACLTPLQQPVSILAHPTLASPTKQRRMRRAALALCLALGALGAALPLQARAASSVYLEDLTSPELKARIAAGATTLLIPIGGTEQSGPNIALGKHNARAHLLAGQIAQALGNAIVAPTIAYVPEGSITPPAAHMRFAGTISVPEATFESVLESAARSFRQHGFTDIFFLGDHGGYQRSESKVASRLNQAWAKAPGSRAYALLDYYRVTQTAYIDALKQRGYSAAEIGTHAGLADTSLSLALDPTQVRGPLLAHGAQWGPSQGVHGNPTRASAALGRLGVRLIVDTSVAAIRTAVKQHAAARH
ncbi:creatininase family protein [Castellaniella caeni]